MSLVIAKPANKKGQTSKRQRVYVKVDGKMQSCLFTEKLVESNLGGESVKAVFETNDEKLLTALKAKGYKVIDAQVKEIKEPAKTPAKVEGVDGGSSEDLTREELVAKYFELSGKKAPSNMLEKTLITKIAELEAAKE